MVGVGRDMSGTGDQGGDIAAIGGHCSIRPKQGCIVIIGKDCGKDGW